MYHRRIPQQQVLFPLRRATLRNRRDLSANELPGQFYRVGYGSRAQNKHRGGSVKAADAPQASDDVGHVRAEHATISVHFVNHDITQTIEELRPARVMRQNALVQYIGV